MPDEIHELLVNLKGKFGCSITSQILQYIARGLIKDGLYPVSNLVSVRYTRRNPPDTNMMPEGVKYCDGDKCEVDYGAIKKRIVVGIKCEK